MKNSFTYLLSGLLLCGCVKDELPVPRADRGGATSHRVCLGSGYAQQIWFDLGTGSVVSENERTAWDLAFESAPDGWHVMLNGSRLMSAWNIGSVDLHQPHDTLGLYDGRRIDAPSGRLDSTAVGDWRSGADVYMIDRGYGSDGTFLGQRQVRFLSVDATTFSFEHTDLAGGDAHTVTVQKDPSRTYTYFSFTSGQVLIEPVLGAWDLQFTQYTHQFYEPYIPYLVNGVLIDGAHTRVAELAGVDFAGVTLGDTAAFPFDHLRNTIGYDWKTYSFETSSYTVVPDRVYIVQDHEGYFFKLRFLEFYGPQGQTGCPLFEVVPL